MNLGAFLVLLIAASSAVLARECSNNKKSTAKLICYYSKLTDIDSCKCSHVVLPSNSDIKAVDRVREYVKGVKILITVNEFNQGLVDLLKSSKVDGIEINLKKLDSKNDISDFISTVRSKLGGDLSIILSVPSKAELLAKYYDFKTLSKTIDLFVLETAFLGASTNVTFHPSRLSGLWDMQNTDSVVDLVNGLGAPLSKLVISAPVQAFKFRLQSEKHTAPGSPALEIQSVVRDELCGIMESGGNWTLERDQDQAGPYIFSKDQWIAFDDATSIDIKAKYARVRGLAGMALKDLSQDGGAKCQGTILEAAFNGLSRQARAPRGAVLHSLEREILETSPRPLDKIQVSPYRISRVIDVEGNVHVIRQDTRTEFECSRQGYFVHPRSCGRFYRCVKFDQLSDEFSVFEFDCPAGLAFDSRVEVCVWPGSLPHASACSGSSEIAPVPRERFICPGEPGYYADPENCRWFFACLDHGKSPLSAYEFRCPFGLVYDESRLLCEWPWLVPKCASGLAIGSEVVYGGSGLLALDQYTGLGVLGATTLGGLHGPLQQPIAKVYSSVGSTNFDLNGSGLSLKAAQSLQNAGLLRTDLDSGRHFEEYSGNLNYAQNAASNINAYQLGGNIQYGGAYAANNFYQNQDSNGYYQTGYAAGAQNLDLAQKNLNVNVGSLGEINSGLIGTVNTGFATGSNLGYASGTTAYSGSGTNLNLGTIQSANAQQINNLAYAAKSAQSLTQYHSNEDNSGTAGNINIVGGGFSAGLEHNIQITNNGNTNLDEYVTASPIQVSTVVPTVTSVPLPSLKVASGFETYNGGVVANVPELQYKLQKPTGYSYQSGIQGSTVVPKASTAFLNLVSSTPSSLAVDGYDYPKPSVAFVEGAVSTPVVVSSTQKPIVNVQQSFVNVGKEAETVVTGYDYPKPVVKFEEERPVTVAPILSYQNVDQGYHYEKPVVKFEEKPVAGAPIVNSQSVSYQKVDTVNQGYHYEKPAIKFEEVRPVTVAPILQTQTVSYQKLDTVDQGYHYEKPAIKFEEVRPVSAAPILNTQSVSYQKVDTVHQGYHYEKPSVAFEEVPIKTVSTVKPIVQTYVQQPVIQQQVIYEKQPQIQITSYNVPSTTIKPQVYVSSTPAPQIVQTYSQGYHYPKPSVTLETKPVTSYTYKDVVHQAVGYSYPKPAIKFEETPIAIQKPVVNTYSYAAPVQYQTYSTPKPTVVVQQQPILTSYAYTAPSTVKPAVLVQKPQVYSTFTVSTPKPISYSIVPVQKQQEIVVQKPAVVSTYSYTAPQPVKPTVLVQEQPVYTYSTPKPQIVVEKQPVVSSYYLPVQKQQENVVVQKPAVVSTYSYTAPQPVKPQVLVQEQPVYTYSTPKPQIVVEKQPVVNYLPVQKPAVVSTYSYTAPQTVKPQVLVKEEPVYTYSTPKPVVPSVSYLPVQKQQEVVVQKPAVVSTYSYVAPQTVKPQVLVQEQPVYTYSTPKPQVIVEKQPVVNYLPVQKPAVVSTYSYTAPQTVKPQVFVKQEPVYTYSTPKPEVFVQKVQQQQEIIVQKPAVVSSYNYVAPQTVKPAVLVQEQPVTPSYSYIPVQKQEKVIVKQPAVVSSYSYTAPTTPKPITVGYEYPKPSVQFVEEPEPIQEIPFVKKKAYITGNTYYNQKINVEPVQKGYVYEKPAVQFEEKPVIVENYQAPIAQEEINLVKYNKVQNVLLQSTPRPTFATAVNTVIAAKAKPAEEFYLYENNLSSTPKPFVKVPIVKTVSSTTSRPIVRYSFGTLDQEYQEPTREYLPVTTVKPRVKITTVQPPNKEYLPVKTRVRVTTQPSREYLPVKSRQRVKVTTEAYTVPEVTISSRNKIRVTSITPLSREYLPSAEENYVATQRPVKVVKVVRPAKTIIKQNDFHPLLSAKLGAQCTCVSNTVKLRKKPLKIVVEEEDDDDNNEENDDGYVVGDQDGDVVVENYAYEPQKVVEISSTPKIIVEEQQQPEIPIVVKKRVRTRPVTSTTTIVYEESPVTEAAELFVKKPRITLIKKIDKEDETTPSDREIVKAVKTGLKLVKQAAKAGAKEGTEEVLNSRDFDRYGPGGVRSRSERLQGTVDCQRAGLFRHPTQCNKFYACRWDCTKNKFTLHVFNCPVHLTFDSNLGACNWPSQGPACLENTLLPNE